MHFVPLRYSSKVFAAQKACDYDYDCDCDCDCDCDYDYDYD
jgi:hypothetical protein